MDTGLIFGFIIAIAILAFVRSGWVIVRQQTAVIIQRLGKFQNIAQAGFNWKLPFLDSVAGRVSLKVQQLDVPVETKTHDDVFVHIKVSVQYMVAVAKLVP